MMKNIRLREPMFYEECPCYVCEIIIAKNEVDGDTVGCVCINVPDSASKGNCEDCDQKDLCHKGKR